MRNYLDAGMRNYVVSYLEKLNIPKKKKKKTFQGYRKMSFDGACVKP
jgi:hypothetical protein